MTANLLVPVYSIFDRDIPLAHIRACVIINPIGPAEDKREASDKTAPSCESGACHPAAELEELDIMSAELEELSAKCQDAPRRTFLTLDPWS